MTSVEVDKSAEGADDRLGIRAFRLVVSEREAGC